MFVVLFKRNFVIRLCYIHIFCPTGVRRNHWGRLAGTCSPVLVWNMQSSVEGENSLKRLESALHFEWREVDGPIKPQDACCCEKGGRIFLSLAGKAKGWRLGFDEEKSLPTKEGFQFQQKRWGISLLSPRSRRRVPFKV